jgi:AP endonuclease-2
MAGIASSVCLSTRRVCTVTYILTTKRPDGVLTLYSGYSGVGIYTRQSVCAPIRAEEGLLGVLCPPNSSTQYRDLPEEQCIGGYPTPMQIADLGVDSASLDAEGRCLVVEFPAFVLFGVYSPANSNGLRDDFRYGFICMLDARIRNLEKAGKKVILTGDLNVSREEIDTAKADEQMFKEGITRDDYYNAPNRRVFNQLLANGKVPGERDEGREAPVLWDLCREFHKEREGMFTHWEQKINARPANFGSRIDYVLCSISIKDWFENSNIQEGLAGSDHCPVYATTKELVDWQGVETHILDVLNPEGMFREGKRLREYNPAIDLLPISGKLLPEFDKRRNIRDMFTKTPTPFWAKATEQDASPSQNSIDLSQSTAGSQSSPVKSNTTTTVSSQPSKSTSPVKLPMKRPQSNSPAAKTLKRRKSSLTSTATSQTKSQRSLRGFFAPKTSDPVLSPTTTTTGTNTPSVDSLLSSPTAAPPRNLPPLDAASADPQASSQASKASWATLFTRKPPPRCEDHAEPCISLTTKKPGVNCGRKFWMCPRPIGPSGAKEKGTQWRCATFIWGSDWNAPGASDPGGQGAQGG